MTYTGCGSRKVMQTSRTHDGLRLTFFRTAPASVPGEDCATLYRSNRGTWIVQGGRREEPELVFSPETAR